MAREVASVITLTSGTLRLHLWCDRCMTSAGWEVSFYRLVSDGVNLFGTVHRCYRCDRSA